VQACWRAATAASAPALLRTPELHCRVASQQRPCPATDEDKARPSARSHLARRFFQIERPGCVSHSQPEAQRPKHCVRLCSGLELFDRFRRGTPRHSTVHSSCGSEGPAPGVRVGRRGDMPYVPRYGAADAWGSRGPPCPCRAPLLFSFPLLGQWGVPSLTVGTSALIVLGVESYQWGPEDRRGRVGAHYRGW
jgi:hypothetical protein